MNVSAYWKQECKSELMMAQLLVEQEFGGAFASELDVDEIALRYSFLLNTKFKETPTTKG